MVNDIQLSHVNVRTQILVTQLSVTQASSKYQNDKANSQNAPQALATKNAFQIGTGCFVSIYCSSWLHGGRALLR